MTSSILSSIVSSITVAELRTLLDRGGISFYDVRRRERFEASGETIPGARWRDPELVESWSRHLAPGGTVVVTCIHGQEVSQNVAAVLRARGLEARYLEGGFEAWRASGNNIARQAPPAKGSTWITRERPKIDRVACPWLVRRFHDPEARFVYVPSERVLPEAEATGAVPYDVPGVEFSHDGDLCSFDVMIRRLSLGDPVLADLAVIVRGADTGRLDSAPEAAGLLAVSLGLSAMFTDDHEMLRHGMTVYDALYARLKTVRGEIHGWPPKG